MISWYGTKYFKALTFEKRLIWHFMGTQNHQNRSCANKFLQFSWAKVKHLTGSWMVTKVIWNRSYFYFYFYMAKTIIPLKKLACFACCWRSTANISGSNGWIATSKFISQRAIQCLKFHFLNSTYCCRVGIERIQSKPAWMQIGIKYLL